MKKEKEMCDFCKKPFANLRSHQENKHPSEIKRSLFPLCLKSNSVYSDSDLQKHNEQEHHTRTVQTKTKMVRPTTKELQKDIFSLEDQLKASNNQNTQLTKEIEDRTKASDLENERIRTNLSCMTTNFNNLRQIYNDKSSELTLMNTKYALLGSESKKISNNKQAQIIILKNKLKLEKDKNSLVQKKLDQEINKNATKNTTSDLEMELNDPLGKFGNQSSHFSIKFHTL